ncbi:hypothetical protein EYZ11_003598 [Aspergillus tanneri]|uniref:Uncharacterized protein n=1 Tax=Aspergillus tanneri TaxID=1220188 RepID=A0A4S3JQ13_9EURO|nr:hypothetical protein EYZ11_003598 [Aspergillus tanneri]
MALMYLSEKPAFVKQDLSIPLDEIRSNNQIQPIDLPLRRWAENVAKYQNETKETFGDVADTIHGVKETRISQIVHGEFGDLKFSYQEAKDGWSCGISAVWNFRCLSKNLPIGKWDTALSQSE